MFVSAFNVTMFVLGAIVLGKKFALTTIVSTFYYPFILSVFQNMPMIGKMTDDKILAVLFAGLMIAEVSGSFCEQVRLLAVWTFLRWY